jgi:hypothetical protein
MAADGSIPIVLAIDVEPDARDNAPGAGVDVAGFRQTAMRWDRCGHGWKLPPGSR